LIPATRVEIRFISRSLGDPKIFLIRPIMTIFENRTETLR